MSCSVWLEGSTSQHVSTVADTRRRTPVLQSPMLTQTGKEQPNTLLGTLFCSLTVGFPMAAMLAWDLFTRKRVVCGSMAAAAIMLFCVSILETLWTGESFASGIAGACLLSSRNGVASITILYHLACTTMLSIALCSTGLRTTLRGPPMDNATKWSTVPFLCVKDTTLTTSGLALCLQV